MRILVVDDDAAGLESLRQVLEDLGHDPLAVASAEAALSALTSEDFPLVVTDIRLPGRDGLTLLDAVKANPARRRSDVILISGHGDIDTAIAALRRGAYDYLKKPIHAPELAAVVERSAEHQALLRENDELTNRFEERVKRETVALRVDLNAALARLRSAEGVGEVAAESEAMKRVLRETGLYHDDPSVPVLIEGETGTGKEIVARLIHFGPRGSDAPFVAINCSSIPSELFESELFGYESGAFTGGRKEGARGKLEAAGEGTLFLDEIGDMPLALQPKLLRVLQERNYYRVGGVKKIPFRARVVCATNQDLAAMMEQGAFRRDLYHRLHVGYLRLPPLRERPEEIAPLARLFLRREAEKKRKRFRSFDPGALALLETHPWPGNVRELENAIERAVLIGTGETLKASDLSFLQEESPGTGFLPLANPERLALPEAPFDLNRFNDILIRKALEKFGGNKTKAAEYLGMSRGAFRNRYDQLDG